MRKSKSTSNDAQILVKTLQIVMNLVKGTSAMDGGIVAIASGIVMMDSGRYLSLE
jgi:hypothetical protein